MDTTKRTLSLETSKRRRSNAPHCSSQLEVARDTLTPLFPKNWASKGGMLCSYNRKKESKMVVAKRQRKEKPTNKGRSKDRSEDLR